MENTVQERINGIKELFAELRSDQILSNEQKVYTLKECKRYTILLRAASFQFPTIEDANKTILEMLELEIEHYAEMEVI